MALKITKASDPITVDRLNVCIYAPPGIGKTSLAFTADSPLLLDFDGGSHRAANRRDTVQIGEWSDVSSITAEDLEPYNTVIVDTAGRALDVLTADIIRANPKHGRGGALTLQGYGELKSRFTAFLKLLNSFGKDVILIAHMDEQRSGDEIIERLDMQGGSKNEVYKAADAMGRISIVNGQRWLNFSPTDAAFGKNPGQLDPIKIPGVDRPEFSVFLSGLINVIKVRLNALSDEQREAVEKLTAWRTVLAGVSDADGVNNLIADAKADGKAVAALLHARATELGLVGDKSKGIYVAKETA